MVTLKELLKEFLITLFSFQRIEMCCDIQANSINKKLVNVVNLAGKEGS